MQHGTKQTFEIAGEAQIVDGKLVGPPAQGFRFGRIFRGLRPFRPTDQSLDALGQTMTADQVRDDGEIPAGYTYFGQFVDHDITRDLTAGRPEEALPLVDDFEADAIKQGRSPSLDLDSLYGGPDMPDPRFLDPNGLHFRLGTTQGIPGFVPNGDLMHFGFDVPRRPGPNDFGEAIIGDPRNDENLIVQQMHLLFLKFHNLVVTAFPNPDPSLQFQAARVLVTRHYQWLVLNDFVRKIVDPDVFEDVLGVDDLAGVTSIAPKPLIFPITGYETPPMPLEFAVAGYRLGHSMVRDDYNWNRFFGPGTPFRFFFRFTKLTGEIGQGTLARFPSNWIADWRRMFPLEDVPGVPPFDRKADDLGPLNMAKLIDTELASALGQLPQGGNLASRNLVRGARNGLPSGQDAVAATISAGDHALKVLTPGEICGGLAPRKVAVIREHEFDVKTPLWYYIMREAEVHAEGKHLGRLGSRIVLETFLALIRSSRVSILNADHATPGELKIFDPASDSPLLVGGAPITTVSHLIAFVGDINPLGDPAP